MELNKQVISLDLAKELSGVMKEKGVIPPDSLYAYYGNAGEWQKTIIQTYIYDDEDSDFVQAKLLPAYTVAELGGMLPEFPCGELMNTIPYLTIGHRWRVDLDDEGMLCSEENEANARCKMLIHLLKNNLITL